MGTNLIRSRLIESGMLPQLRTLLETWCDRDAQLLSQPNGGQWIRPLFAALGGEPPTAIEAFEAAWVVFASWANRLDHIQDGDDPGPLDWTVPVDPRAVGQIYNRAITYLVASQSLLDDLDAAGVPHFRVARLRRYWTDCLLRALSGQQLDLEQPFIEKCSGVVYDARRELEDYQAMVAAKAGPIYALSFAGTAILATDDSDTIERLARVGELLGALLQFGDDIHDFDADSPSSRSLAHIIRRVSEIGQDTQRTRDVLQAYWSTIVRSNYQVIEQSIEPLEAPVKQLVRTTFAQMFMPNVATTEEGTA